MEWVMIVLAGVVVVLRVLLAPTVGGGRSSIWKGVFTGSHLHVSMTAMTAGLISRSHAPLGALCLRSLCDSEIYPCLYQMGQMLGLRGILLALTEHDLSLSIDCLGSAAAN